MNNDKINLDPLDEALRVLSLEADGALLSRQIEQVMHTDFPVEVTPEIEQQLLLKLARHMPLTLGMVLKNAMEERQVTSQQLSEESQLPLDMLGRLLNDSIFISNIPIVLFRKVVTRLQVSFNTIQMAVHHTADLLRKQQDRIDPNSVRFAFFRKDNGETHLGNNKQEGHALFENEEAIELYLKRLEELMKAE